MATITEDYVSFETAKLLKEKGFNELIPTYYEIDLEDDDEEDIEVLQGTYHRNDSFYSPNCYSAPTLQMAMKWLREVHNIHISVYPFNRELPITENTYYTCDVATKKDSPIRGHLRGVWKTYEKAAEAAIEYGLEHLI